MSDLRNAMQNMTIDVEKSLPPCTACQRDVSTRDSVQVFQLPYHRDCLNCARCKTSLGQHAGTNNIAEYKSRPICIDCHCFYQGKTCAKCGEGAAHAVNALGKRFHKHCFTCAGCNKELGGSFVEEDGRPFHEDCVRRMASGAVSSDVDPNNAWQIMKDSEEHKCHTCQRVIPLGEGLSVKAPFKSSAGASGRVFFHEHDCFRCESCRAPLKGQFVMGDSGFFCHSCADKQGTKPIKGDPCAKCREPLSGSIKRALGKDYHANCFVCAKCSRAFPNNEFFDVSGAPHCERCV